MRQYAWLNDASQQFLDRDYLRRGQSVEDRVSEICERAEAILGKPGWGAKFHDYFARGFYSLSTPIWSNFGTDRGLPISCVVGETWVNTRVDGGKQARDVKVGDEVLTHRGRYRKVTDVMVTEGRGDIYRLKVMGRMTPIHLTGNHPVLTNLGWVPASDLDPNIHLVATNRVLEMAEAVATIDLRPFTRHEFVEKDGRLCKSASQKVRRDRRKEVVSYCAAPFADIRVDEDLAWALGVWFAEGSVGGRAGSDPNGIRITTHVDETAMADRWLEVMTRAFGVNGRGSTSQAVRGNGKKTQWRNVNLHSKTVGNLFASFGLSCKSKTIPQWLIESPTPILASLLDGILAGDGSDRPDGTIKITLANPRLLLQVYQIGLRLGRTMSLQMQDKPGRWATTAHVYTILFRDERIGRSKAKDGAAIAFSDGLNYAAIRTIERTDRVETVYDFTVEEDHSFSAAGVVLHNCFGSTCDDSMHSILTTNTEIGMMSKVGGGTSVYLGKLRGRNCPIQGGANGVSSGSVHFAELYQATISLVSQGSARRGSCAVYQDVFHRDIMEFLGIKSEGHPIQHLSFGVCVPDWWLREMEAGDRAKREVWAMILKRRLESGYPYLTFTDAANDQKPDVYKDKGMMISHSQLCNEVLLPDDLDESFVCDLMSMNDAEFDAWEGTDAVEMAVELLDANMTEFISKAEKIPGLERAVRFARRHRAIGLGQLGFHTYLQRKSVPFESLRAKAINVKIARTIYERALAASRKMAAEYGEPELLSGYGRRHTTVCAIAPTKSSSWIIGQVSEGIEPIRANVVVKDLQKGKFTWRNPELRSVLSGLGRDTDETWRSILEHGGSVQHLDWLPGHDREVFKTFGELSQLEVVRLAAGRQPYVDQGQSLNLMIDPSTPIKEVNQLHLEAWRLGLKGLYYLHGVNAAQRLQRNLMACTACEA